MLLRFTNHHRLTLETRLGMLFLSLRKTGHALVTVQRCYIVPTDRQLPLQNGAEISKSHSLPLTSASRRSLARELIRRPSLTSVVSVLSVSSQTRNTSTLRSLTCQLLFREWNTMLENSERHQGHAHVKATLSPTLTQRSLCAYVLYTSNYTLACFWPCSIYRRSPNVTSCRVASQEPHFPKLMEVRSTSNMMLSVC